MKNRLEIFLATRKLTSVKLSADTGINKDILSNIRQNKAKRINVENISKLCNYFDCNIEDLFYIERENNNG